MKHMEDIDKIIKKAALDGALTEGAVKQFHQLLEENVSLRLANESQEKQLSSKRDDCVKLSGEVKELTTVLNTMVSREKNLEEREEKMTNLELTATHQSQRVTDHQEMVKLIFRNTVLRHQAMTPGHAGIVDQYGTHQGAEYSTKHDLEKEDK